MLLYKLGCHAAVSPAYVSTYVSSLAADAPAVIMRFIQSALCWPFGMFPSVTAAPSFAAALNVTEVGAVFSFATVCSVAFMADDPAPISTVVPDDPVFVETQTLAFCNVREP